MGSFKLASVSMENLFHKSPCKMYPVVTPEYFPLTAGHIENSDIDTCILCGMCAKRCPTHAIEVDRDARTWSINRFMCVGCNSCVRVCPKKVLVMERSYQAPSTQKERDYLTKPETPEDAQKAARIAAAKAAAAAKKDDAPASAPEQS